MQDTGLASYNFKNRMARNDFIISTVNKYRAFKEKWIFHRGNKEPDFKGVIFCVDGHRRQGGLSDRLSGAIMIYAFCKARSIPFKFHHIFPFDIINFLMPNRYDWRIESKDVVYSKKTTPFFFLGDPYQVQKYNKIANIKGQRHIYTQSKNISGLNKELGTSFVWNELFEELFKPSELLVKDLAEIKKSLPEKYISICFRHSNLFGDFKEYSYSEASDEIKEYVVNVCRKGIEEKINQSGLPTVVTSDSVAFLNRISDMKDVYVFNHNKSISHMDTVKDDSLKSYEQSFLDLYVLGGGGQKIYSLQHKYYHRHSGFPWLASICFGKELIQEWLDDDK